MNLKRGKCLEKIAEHVLGRKQEEDFGVYGKRKTKDDNIKMNCKKKNITLLKANGHENIKAIRQN